MSDSPQAVWAGRLPAGLDPRARALNDSLPALPIPSFTLPSSVSAYGLPGGAQLGITSPSLSRSGNHLLLRGGFGRR